MPMSRPPPLCYHHHTTAAAAMPPPSPPPPYHHSRHHHRHITTTMPPSPPCHHHHTTTRTFLAHAISSGDQCRKKRTCERRGHLLCSMLVTEDTSQLPISWSNAPASRNTAQVPHTPHATENAQQKRKNEARSEFKTFSCGFARKTTKTRHGMIGLGPGAVVAAHDFCTCNPFGDRSRGKERAREGGTYCVAYRSRKTRPSCQYLGRTHFCLNQNQN
jgi:hypothetical protein